MNTFDPRLPVSLSNWPRGLKMPPLKVKQPKAEKPNAQTKDHPDDPPPLWDPDPVPVIS
jgi:hypothetical protein